MCVIAIFRGGADEKCSLLGYYTVDSGYFFSDVAGQSVGSIQTGCPEMSVRNYHYSMRNNAEDLSSHPEDNIKMGRKGIR
jgi:hypothetical protein